MISLEDLFCRDSSLKVFEELKLNYPEKFLQIIDMNLDAQHLNSFIKTNNVDLESFNVFEFKQYLKSKIEILEELQFI